MKKLKELLTPEQMEQYKDVYIIGDCEMHPVFEKSKPTEDTFKAVAIDSDGNLAVYTAEDFIIDGDGDFIYENINSNHGCYVYRDYMPAEVIELLEAVMEAK